MTFFLVKFGTVIYYLVTFLLAFSFFFFCRWGSHGAIYQNKGNAYVKIICKTYDCYGTSEGCRLFKQREILAHVYWVTMFDDTKVDTAIWEEVH